MLGLPAIVRDIFVPLDKESEQEQDYIHKRANITIRLYHKHKMVHQQHVTCRVHKEGAHRIVYGASQAILMDGFHGHVDEITIALINVPHEVDISPVEDPWPLQIFKGNTLTLQARRTGLLFIDTTSKS